jgi:hypothetical protein
MTGVLSEQGIGESRLDVVGKSDIDLPRKITMLLDFYART